MAQAGYTPISLYYSTTPAAVPVNTDLVAGELALNTIDEKLYFKNSSGTVKLLASTASTTNVASISFGSTGLTPSTATTGAVTVAGTLSTANGGTGSTSTTYCSLTSNVTGTLPIGNGGTNITTYTTGDILYASASNTLAKLPIGSSGQLLSISGGVPAWAAAPSTGLDVGTTAITSGTSGYILYNNAGTLGNLATTGSGSVVLATSPTLTTPVLGTPTSGTLTNCTGYSASNLSGSISLTTQVTGTLPVGNGGTGATTITANSVILGNGTSALSGNLVAPGASGNVLTSNGTTWTSAAASGGQFQTEIFTAPGTWTKPSSCTQVRVTVIGGGGGGGINNAQSGGSGGTSSFGPAVSATGGGGGSYGNPSGSTGSNGTGTVSSGTTIKTGNVRAAWPSTYSDYANGVSFGIISGGGGLSPSSSPGAGIAYSTTSGGMAGSAGYGSGNFPGKGGVGGLACAANVPVTGPVSVTVGSGGANNGSNPGVARSTGGVVLVEYVG